MRPQQSATVHTEILDQEVCVYDWQRHEVHALNPTAARVWRLCDGKTTEAEIVARLAADWGAERAATLVRLALAEFDAKHLLREDAGRPLAAPLSRRQAMKRLGLAAAALPVVTSIVAPRAVDAASVSGSQTFGFTGAQQTFTVPTGVSTVTIAAYGAQGGNGGNGGYGLGGQGGSVTATITVTPGQTLSVYVGGAGGNGSNINVAGAAGFNGGGLGTVGGTLTGGGGGGASDVRQGGSALTNRVVVAGGGGGGGFGLSGYSAGGAGGGTTGGTGGSNNSPSPNKGGDGGTQSAGGAGGTSGNGGTTGGNGTLGTGGAGGNVNPIDNSGGGGGGYYGGGGGSGSGSVFDGGGGGGGSSYSTPTATGVTNTQGGHTGNGQVVISW